MFKSKKDVDAHVRDVFAKCKLENERLKLCFGIAKQYCSIREFDSARRYLETYLNSNPVNPAEAHKLMGDVQHELGDFEKSLEFYKISYTEGKTRDSLNRVCDLLSRGYGSKESPESKKKWFDMQKSTVNNNPLSAANSTASSPVVPRRAPVNVGGPPKTGFNHSFTNGNTSPMISSPAVKTNGNNVDLQLRYLERRFDDGLGKILDQNTQVLEQMLKIKEDMKDLADKVEHVAVNQENMQLEMRELKERQRETQVLALENQQNRYAVQQMRPTESCKNCDGRPIAKEMPVHQPCHTAGELAALKEQMDRLEKRTTAAIENLQDSFRYAEAKSHSVGSAFNFGIPNINGSVNPALLAQTSMLFPTGPSPMMLHQLQAAAGVSTTSMAPPPSFTLPSYEMVPPPQVNVTSTNSTVIQPTVMGQASTMTCQQPLLGQTSILPTQPTVEWPTSTVTPEPKPTPSFVAPNNDMTVTPPQNITATTAPIGNSLSVVDCSTPKKSEEKESVFPALNLSGKFSFADLAKNNSPSTFSFGNPSNVPAFSGVGAPLFSSLPSSADEKHANTSANAEEGEDDFVPTAEFQPVIPLPPLVEVKKGDEDENTIAEYRSKLYRYIAETKEWKERGIGNVKLLQSKTDEKKCRVVMWREKIGKLACNFSLFPDFKVTNYQNNPKVLCWKCQDFAEDPCWETFTLRFGNEENCAHFKAEMERLAKLTVAVVAGESSPSSIDKASPSETAAAHFGAQQVPLSQLFKKAEGSWNCDTCYCTNGNDAISCVACQTCRPGYEDVPKPAPKEEEATQPKFSFGFPAANTSAPTFNFGFANSNTSATSGSVSAVDGVTPKQAEEENKGPAFAGLNLSGKFSFADLAKNNNSTSTFSFPTPTNQQSFSGAGAPLFSSISASNTSAERTANAEEGDDDFVPTAEFQPVIPLPPLVEVKKGDEDENTIAEYRAKLYRYIAETKEWKERGVGNVKLLQSKTDDRKCRVVMWREKIGKLACNFSLFPDFKVTNYQNNPKVLCWKCQDFAEDPGWETFTLRFGNEENCAHFKAEMERLAKLTVAVVAGGSSPSSIDKAPPSETAAAHFGAQQVPLSQLFKKAEGSWNCDTCYCTNGSETTSCVSCQTKRPGLDSVIAPQGTDGISSSCPGCVGCNPEAYSIPERKLSGIEDIIELPLSPDSSNEPLTVVTLNLFTSSSGSSEIVNSFPSNVETATDSECKGISSVDSKGEAKATNLFSNFSFSNQTPEKSSPISFQLKTPSFSFKPEDNASIFGAVGSIFTPPAGGNPPGSTPSPFVSPFAQQPSLLNTSASPQMVPFSFSQPLFNQQSPTQSPNNEDVREQREEDEYEDVDDEEEDECMFEEDAHVYIKDDADSGDNFNDKGNAVVRVLYDGESYCARLVIIIDGETITEHLVAADTILESKGELTYEWNGICNYESPVKSRIKAVFNDDEACTSFATVIADSLEFAEQAGITEALLLEETPGY